MITIHTNSVYADIRISDNYTQDESTMKYGKFPTYVFEKSNTSLELMASSVRLGESHRILKIDLKEELEDVSSFDKFEINIPSKIFTISDVDTGNSYFEYFCDSSKMIVYIKHHSLENFTHLVLERG